MKRINVSLDTLDPDKFRAITRWGDLDKVMEGIDAAQAAGLEVKINAVALKGVNEDEFARSRCWAHGRGMDLTLIEVMPLGDIGGAGSTNICRCRWCARGLPSATRSKTSTTAPAALPAMCASTKPAAGSASSRR